MKKRLFLYKASYKLCGENIRLQIVNLWYNKKGFVKEIAEQVNKDLEFFICPKF